MRALFAKLLILLMSVHILVPAGFMLDHARDGSGDLTLVICHADFSDPSSPLHPGGDTDRNEERAQQLLCPYASIGATALDETTPDSNTGPVAYDVVEFPAAATQTIAIRQWRRPSARAPPIAT